MFCVDKIKYEHSVILSDIKKLPICIQISDLLFFVYVANLRIMQSLILPKIIPLSHHNI